MTRLDGLPSEVFESIVVHLDLRDACHLRLASPLLAFKATQDHFKSFFRSKRVDVTKQSLAVLVSAIRAGYLGCLMEDLTLVGIVNNPKGLEARLRTGIRFIDGEGPMFVSKAHECDAEEIARARHDLKILRQRQTEYEALLRSGRLSELLTEAFRNIVANGKANSLRKLTLEVAVYRKDAETRLLPSSGGGWKYIWQATADTYHMTMSALAASSLPVDYLDFFCNPRMTRCSLARNELSATDFKHPGLTASLAHVRSLALSLSNRVIADSDRDMNNMCDPDEAINWSVEAVERDIEVLRAEAADESNFTGLAQLIVLCSNVQEFEIHSYALGDIRLRAPDFHNHRLLQCVVETSSRPMPRLSKCTLRGLHVRERDLAALIRQAPIKELILREVHMDIGTYKSIFAYCVSEAARLEQIRFDDLFKDKLVYFADGTGEQKFQSVPPVRGTNTLVRGRVEMTRPIEYHFSEGRPLGLPQLYWWRQRRRHKYGPP